jgi:hypothetical protein
MPDTEPDQVARPERFHDHEEGRHDVQQQRDAECGRCDVAESGEVKAERGIPAGAPAGREGLGCGLEHAWPRNTGEDCRRDQERDQDIRRWHARLPCCEASSMRQGARTARAADRRPSSVLSDRSYESLRHQRTQRSNSPSHTISAMK